MRSCYRSVRILSSVSIILTFCFQVIYVFYQLCSHPASRQYVQQETEATPYLLDLLHDRNTEVQKVCDATLQRIGEVSQECEHKLLTEKFRYLIYKMSVNISV